LSFDNPESARKAKEDLNGKYLPGFEGWNRTLIIEFFLTKNERQFIENHDTNYANYFMNKNNNQNMPMSYIGGYQYPYSYPYNYPPGNQGYPISFNQFGNYGFKKNWRGGNKNNRNNNFRNNTNYNNNYNRGNNNYKKKNNNRDQKVEENEEKNKNKIDLSDYYKLESIEDKKDYLGEKIFKAIEDSPISSERKVDIETIGKITGMIIELPDQKEIIEILENQDILNSRIEEALNLLEGKAE